ncbi:unnamed protein product, partial [marine sediment metagenome]
HPPLYAMIRQEEGKKIPIRQRRMDWLVKMLKSAEPPIETRKFVATCAYNQAVSMKVIREYLQILEDMEVLIDDGEEIVWQG